MFRELLNTGSVDDTVETVDQGRRDALKILGKGAIVAGGTALGVGAMAKIARAGGDEGFEVYQRPGQIQSYTVRDGGVPVIGITAEFLRQEERSNDLLNRYDMIFKSQGDIFIIDNIRFTTKKQSGYTNVPMDWFVNKYKTNKFDSSSPLVMKDAGVGVTCPPDISTWTFTLKNQNSRQYKVDIIYDVSKI